MTKNYSVKQDNNTSLIIHIKSHKDNYSIFELVLNCFIILVILIVINLKIPLGEDFLFFEFILHLREDLILLGFIELYFLFWLFRTVKLIIWFVKGHESIKLDKSNSMIFFHRKGFGKFHKNQFDLDSTKFILVKKYQVEHFYTAENRTSNGLKNGQLVFERLSKKWYQSIYFHFGHSLTDIELEEVHHLIQSKINR